VKWILYIGRRHRSKCSGVAVGVYVDYMSAFRCMLNIL
jgi:hypothetical protein